MGGLQETLNKTSTAVSFMFSFTRVHFYALVRSNFVRLFVYEFIHFIYLF